MDAATKKPKEIHEIHQPWDGLKIKIKEPNSILQIDIVFDVVINDTLHIFAGILFAVCVNHVENSLLERKKC